jgi:MFS family permease
MSYGTYATVLLALVNAANYMDRSILSILAQPIKNELKLSDSQLGLLLGPAFVLLFALVAVPLGRLADRAGRRWVLAASAMVWSFFSTASGFAHSLAQLAIARVGIGVGESGGMPSSHALISAFYPPNRRAVPFSIFTAGATFGIALGLGFGGFIASRYGWRAAFVATGVPGFVLAVLVAATLPEPHSVARQSVPLARVRFWVALQGLSRIRTYRWIVCSHPCYTFITTGVLAWFPSFYIRTHGMGLQYVGTFFGIVVGVGVSGANILGAVVAQRLDRRAPQRGLTFSAWTTLLGFPFYITALLAPTGTLSLVLSTCFFMLMGAAGAPIISGQQGVIAVCCQLSRSRVGTMANRCGESGVDANPGREFAPRGPSGRIIGHSRLRLLPHDGRAQLRCRGQIRCVTWSCSLIIISSN